MADDDEIRWFTGKGTMASGDDELAMTIERVGRLGFTRACRSALGGTKLKAVQLGWQPKSRRIHVRAVAAGSDDSYAVKPGNGRFTISGRAFLHENGIEFGEKAQRWLARPERGELVIDLSSEGEIASAGRGRPTS
jgi:hypothetical protein